MAIEFRCTQCVRLLRVPDDTAGRPAQCPGCGALMTIPGGPGLPAGEMHGTGAMPNAGAGTPLRPSYPRADARGLPGHSEGDGPIFAGAKIGTVPGANIGTVPRDSDNPYQSPLHYGESVPLGGLGRAGTPAGRVIAPAIGLIAVAVLEIEMLVGMVVAGLMGFAEAGARGPGGRAFAGPAFVGSAVVLGMAVLGVVLSVLVIVGAVKMKNLESRGLAMAAAVAVMLPIFMPGFLLGLPLGIWALVVLCDPQVKPLFETRTSHVY